MPAGKPYIGPRKLVVAFDIGTTYSGISYCILEPGQVPDIRGVTKFPKQDLVKGDAKVPSLLYYDKSGNFKAAGAEVLSVSTTEAAITGEWTKAEWWKLYLRPTNLASDIRDDLPPLPSGKSAVDVLTDFVKYLFQCLKVYIQETHRAFPWPVFENTIEYILTHPNGWEGEQQVYREAVVRAGLIPGTPEGHSRVHLLTEGEASLHYCAPNLLDLDAANPTTRHGVVIIDAGGGTIDLSMFSMTSNPISCEEIAPAECELQGAAFVTRRAKEMLKRKLQGWDRYNEEELSEITREFDSSTKLTIKSDQEPAYIKVGGRRLNNAKYNIVYGRLKLLGTEATGLFNDSGAAIIRAFERQQKYAKTRVNIAFFVGGLSTNDWLWSKLQSYFKTKDIIVSRPDSHVNKAVAHGAVLSLIDRDSHLVGSRIARTTYGVVRSLRADKNNNEHVQRKQKWETDVTGDRYVPGHFEAKIRKGDQMREETEFLESFSAKGYPPIDFGTQAISLVCYRGNLSDPKWVDQDPASFSTFCTIHANLSEAKKDVIKKTPVFGRAYYELDYSVIVSIGLTGVRAQVSWKTGNGERRVPATILYGR